MPQFNPEQGKHRLAENLFNKYSLRIRCSTCDSEEGCPGHIRDQGGVNKDNHTWRRWACRRYTTKKQLTGIICPIIGNTKYIELARTYLDPVTFSETVEEVAAKLESLGEDYRGLYPFRNRQSIVATAISAATSASTAILPVAATATSTISATFAIPITLVALATKRSITIDSSPERSVHQQLQQEPQEQVFRNSKRRRRERRREERLEGKRKERHEGKQPYHPDVIEEEVNHADELPELLQSIEAQLVQVYRLIRACRMQLSEPYNRPDSTPS